MLFDRLSDIFLSYLFLCVNIHSKGKKISVVKLNSHLHLALVQNSKMFRDKDGTVIHRGKNTYSPVTEEQTLFHFCMNSDFTRKNYPSTKKIGHISISMKDIF